jgi:hypothetical protein
VLHSIREASGGLSTTPYLPTYGLTGVKTRAEGAARMLRQAYRFLSLAALGASLASAGIVTLLGFWIFGSAFIQSCVESYRQAHPDLEFFKDSIGFPLMSSFFAAMAWKISKTYSEAIDRSFNWVAAYNAILILACLFVIASANLAVLATIFNRQAAIGNHCQENTS